MLANRLRIGTASESDCEIRGAKAKRMLESEKNNDVVVAMLQLMRSSIENQRYILVGANISYEEIMIMICKALHVKAPRKVASKFLLSVGWRADWLLSKIIGRKRKLTTTFEVTFFAMK